MEQSFSTGPLIPPNAAPPEDAGPRGAAPQPPTPAKMALWIAAFALEVLALVAFSLEMVFWNLIDFWFPVIGIAVGTVAGGIGFLLQIRKRIGGSRRLRIHPFEAIGRIGIVTGPVFLLVAIAVAVNCGLDTSMPEPILLPVVDMRVSHGDSTSYHLEVKSWRPGEQTLTLRVDSDLYQQVESVPKAERAVLVEAHNGRLGMAWHGDVTLAPRTRSAPGSP